MPISGKMAKRPASSDAGGKSKKVIKRPAAIKAAATGNDTDTDPAMENQAEIRAKRRILELEAAKDESVCELPPHIIDRYKKTKSMSSGRNAKLREIAMHAIEKLPGVNKYKLVVQHPYFEERWSGVSSHISAHVTLIFITNHFAFMETQSKIPRPSIRIPSDRYRNPTETPSVIYRFYSCPDESPAKFL